MSEFQYKSKYGTYNNCYFRGGMYENGNTAIEIWSNEEGPITKVTINPDIRIDEDCIAIKNYSENEGMLAWLQSMGFVEFAEPIKIINSGYVMIPVYRMTDKLKSHLLGEVI